MIAALLGDPAAEVALGQNTHELVVRFLSALDLPPGVLTRDRAAPLDAFAGFLALESPHAGALRDALAAVGVATDSRGRYLRLGPAPYLSDDRLREAVARLGHVVGEVVARL